jgi:hypothetical protein
MGKISLLNPFTGTGSTSDFKFKIFSIISLIPKMCAAVSNIKKAFIKYWLHRRKTVHYE